MGVAIQIDNVTKAYGKNIVIQGLSAEIQPGEFFTLLGPSGCGKTTLLRMIIGFNSIEDGEIRVDGKVINQIPTNRRNMGMVFQNSGSSFCPVRTVGAQLYEEMTEHGPVTKKEFAARAEALLMKLGFEDGRRVLRSYPFELSGGMQQRAGIAAAMLLEPRVLLADEPTSALDVTVQKQVLEALRSACRTCGTAMVLVTHNIGVIGAMADRVLVMQNGAAVEYGRTQEILREPQTEYTRALLSAVPRLRRS